VEIKEFL